MHADTSFYSTFWTLLTQSVLYVMTNRLTVLLLLVVIKFAVSNVVKI
jgi:hypothetical protein